MNERNASKEAPSMTINVREYTVSEVARHLQVSEPAIRHAILQKQLPVIRRLGRVKVTPEAIEEWLRARERRSA
jgi:excisionase family DNA binding protein